MTTIKSMRRQPAVLYMHSLLRCWFLSSQGSHCPQRSSRRSWTGSPLPWSNLRRGFCRTRLLSSGMRSLWQILWPLWSWCKWVLDCGNEVSAQGRACCWAGRDAACGNTSLERGVRAYLSRTKTMKRRQEWVQKITWFLFFYLKSWLQPISFVSILQQYFSFILYSDFIFIPQRKS